MNFSEALNKEATHTHTDNGAEAFNTTGSSCLDLFSCIGAVRDNSEERVEGLFDAAFTEDPLTALKIAFYGRDIREGLGERKVFRTILHWLGTHHPDALKPNLGLIGVYGRYDDLYALVDTRLEEDMWSIMKVQFEEDLKNQAEGKPVSLFAKWVKTADSHRPATRQLGILTALKLGYSVYDFKRKVKFLRKTIGVVEQLMSNNRWEEIEYPVVPSRAMFMYRNAFNAHDKERFSEFVAKAAEGKIKVHSDTLYPYDIVGKFLEEKVFGTEEQLLEAQWNQLPNYVEEGSSVLVMADVSASMERGNMRPLATSVGLALYFAERNKGAYHNKFITFSEKPTICTIKGSTLSSKVNLLKSANWGNNTNFEAALKLVLGIAVKNRISQEEMVKSLVVVSDMEFDAAIGAGGYWGSNFSDWGFFPKMKDMFESHGYKIPNIVFWNVYNSHDLYHTDANHQGVQLVSGQSVSTFKTLTKCIGMTPFEMMREVIGSDRYKAIVLG